MYRLTIALILLMLCSLAVADTGKIIAYGHELEIVGPLTEDSFTGLYQDTLRLNGWPVQPLRCVNPTDYQAKAREATDRFELIRAAQKHGRKVQITDGYAAGAQAMMETLALRPDLVASSATMDAGPSLRININWADDHEATSLFYISPEESQTRIELVEQAHSLSASNDLSTGAQYLLSSDLVSSVVTKSKGLLINWHDGSRQGIDLNTNLESVEPFDDMGFREGLIQDIIIRYAAGGIISFGCADGFPYQTYDPVDKTDQVNTVLYKIRHGEELDVFDTQELALAADPIVNDIRNAQGGQ